MHCFNNTSRNVLAFTFLLTQVGPYFNIQCYMEFECRIMSYAGIYNIQIKAELNLVLVLLPIPSLYRVPSALLSYQHCGDLSNQI